MRQTYLSMVNLVSLPKPIFRSLLNSLRSLSNTALVLTPTCLTLWKNVVARSISAGSSSAVEVEDERRTACRSRVCVRASEMSERRSMMGCERAVEVGREPWWSFDD